MSILFEDFWLDVFLGLAVLLYIFYRFWTKDYTYWKDRDVPFVEPSFPFGNVRDQVLVRKFVGTVFQELYFKLKGNKYGGFMSMRRPDLLLIDPEIIKLILTKDFTYFTSRGRPFDEEVDPILAHLFNLNGERWRVLRMKLSPTFTSGKMKMMFHLMKACGQELQKNLSKDAEKGEVVELKDYMARFGTDIIGSCAFGLDINSINNPDSEFRVLTKDVSKASLAMIIRDHIDSIIPGLHKYIRVKSSPKVRDDFFLRIVGDTIEYREKNNIKRNDFLDLLIELKNKGHIDDDLDGSNEAEKISNNNHFDRNNSSNDIDLTRELMTAQCFVFFIAGYETSSTTLSFCLFELAINKPIQLKLQQEIDRVLTKHNGDVSYEALKDMTYMDTVVQEALRKYSPVGALTRECIADYKMPDSKLIVKKGTKILIPLYGLHYDPEYYPDPERFDPDRFTDEAKQSRPHYTWLPFGEGPRNCIGMRFGLLQVKIGLTSLLSKYNFDRAPETQVPIKLSPSLLLGPEHGIYLKISRRI